jgi:hypothetical protein
MAMQTPAQPPGSAPPPPRPRGRIAKKWWWSGGVGIIAIILVAVSATTAPTAGSHPASANAPTASPSPPAPTAAVSVAPTAAPAVAPKAIPVLPAVTLTGRGDSVVRVPAQFDGQPALITAKNSGANNFSVWSLGIGNSQQQLLVNTIGNFSGVEAMDFDGSTPAGSLQIGDNGGRWSITFSDPAAAPTFAASTGGSGDAVVVYNGGPGTARFTSDGQGNFAVLQFSATGSSENLLVTEIGNYTGSVPLDPGFLVITSDGRWTVTVSP